MDSRIFSISRSVQPHRLLETSSPLGVTQMQPSKKLHLVLKILTKRSKCTSDIIYYRDNLDISGNFTSLDASNNTLTPMKTSKCTVLRTIILYREKGSIICT